MLKAGSQLTPSTTTWDQPGVAQKRRDLCERGLVMPADGLLLLLQDIALPSLTNAARLVLGTNELATVWRTTCKRLLAGGTTAGHALPFPHLRRLCSWAWRSPELRYG